MGLPDSLQSPIDVATAFPGLTRPVVNPPVDAAAVPLVRAGDSSDIVEDSAVAAGTQTVDALFAGGAHVPVVVAGRISKPMEVDTYLLTVKPGMTLNLTADTQSIPSPAAPQIDVLHPTNNSLLASSEDRGTVDYAVPGDLNQIKVSVRNLNNQAGPYHLYRLRAIPAGQPNFSWLETNVVPIAKGGASVVRIDVNRMGYGGPIKLAASGPFQIDPQEIPAGANKVFVKFVRRRLVGGWHAHRSVAG